MTATARPLPRWALGASLALLYAANSVSLQFATVYWRALAPQARSGLQPLAIQTSSGVIAVIGLGRLMRTRSSGAVLTLAGAVALVLVLAMPSGFGEPVNLASTGFIGCGLFGAISYMVLWTAGGSANTPREGIERVAPILFFGAFSIAALAAADVQLTTLSPGEVAPLFAGWMRTLGGVALIVLILGWWTASRHTEDPTEPKTILSAPADGNAPNLGWFVLSSAMVYATMVLGKMLAHHHLVSLGVPTRQADIMLHVHRVAMFGGSIVPLALASRFSWRMIAATGLLLYVVTFLTLLFCGDRPQLIEAAVLLLGLAWSITFVALIGAGFAAHFRSSPARYGLFAAMVFPLAGSVSVLSSAIYDRVGWPLSNTLLLAASATLLGSVIVPMRREQGVLRWTV